MTSAVVSRRQRRERRKGRRVVSWAFVCVVAAILFAVVWVVGRGLIAKGELEAAVPLASTLKGQVLVQDTDLASQTAAALENHASRAVALTSDPVWRMAELVPWVGPNLAAFRELASVVGNLSTDAVAPLAQLAASIQVADFKPVNGTLNPQALVDARPVIEDAAAAVGAAERAIAEIDDDVLVGPIRAAKVELADQIAAVAAPVHVLRTTAVLLPDMLGMSAPRDYLLLFQNPAELRASGGIPGALALLRVESGRINLESQASASEFGRFKEPVLPLTQDTRGLYGDFTGEWMQNVNLTPRFPLSASLAAEMWKQKFGSAVTGVISIDPIALSYLLEATGPITLPTGDVLSPENAVSLLLRDAYTRYEEPEQQDLFFAAAASAVFDKVASGDLDPARLVDALARSGVERRINVWSAVEAEQSELVGTTLAGALPSKTNSVQPFGVYLNDGTEAKMGYYLDVATAEGSITCRKDGRPYYGVSVTLKNMAPANASDSLPDYVTGNESAGVPRGNIKTVVNVYGTPELQNLGVLRDGVTVPYLPASDSKYQVSQIAIELAPGESTTLQFGFLGDARFDGDVVIEQTPVINRHETQKVTLACDSPLW